MLLNRINSKKAQTAEAMTWVVATIIILIFTFLFLFVVSIMSKSKVELSFFGSGFFEGEDAGVASQQMLFAILNSKSNSNEKEIKALIEEAQYEEVRQSVEEILGKFKEEIKCNFFVKDLNRGGYLVNINNGADGERVSLNIGQMEVGLECSQ